MMTKNESREHFTKRINVISDVLRTTPDNDNLGLLFAISEGFNEIEKLEENWRIVKQAEEEEYNDNEEFIAQLLNLDDEIVPAHEPAGIQRGGLRTLTGNSDAEETEADSLVENDGIFATERPPFWNLKVVLKSFGSTREKRIVATVAWLVCVISLIIGLVIISQEFMESRSSKSKAIRYTAESSLVLPDLQICNVATSFPPFVHLPTKEFVGQPTTWVDALILPGPGTKVVKYPQTHNASILPQVRISEFSRDGKTCQAGGKADPVKFARETHYPPSCFYCLYIKRDPGIVIKNTRFDSTNYFKRLVLRVSRSRLTEKCRLSFATPSFNERRAFRAIISSHGHELERRGILDFGGMNISNPEDSDKLFPAFRSITRDFSVRDVIDMYCNVYLFSGYFYPATKGEIRYKFMLAQNRLVGRWHRSGRGPYFPAHYEEWFQILTKRSNLNGTIGGELKDFYISRADVIVSFTNATESGYLQQLSAQHPGSIAEINLEKAKLKGKEVYSGLSLNTELRRVDTRGVDYVYIMTIGFREFVTREETDQATMSATRFLADFFGLISLFLDISVYTVFVAPIVMRFKRRQIRESTKS